MKPSEHLSNLLSRLPSEPGVYKHFNDDGQIIYVGKAKNLKKRVSSYFNRKKYENRKTRILVGKIRDIEWMVTPTEQDALLLESTLIKEHKPIYNILLKDDKTFPFLVLKKEPFPRVFPTRQTKAGDGEYFGPFTSIRSMYTVLDLCKELYPIRTCSLNLSKKNIDSGKFRVCLEYHVGNCLGPCVGKQSEESYEESISSIRHVLKGNLGDVKEALKKSMKEAVADLAFEKAEGLKSKLKSLEKYQAKSTVVHPLIDNVDVFTISSDSSCGYINCMHIVSGAVVKGRTFEVKKRLDESDVALMHAAIPFIRDEIGSSSPDIYTSMKVAIKMEGVRFYMPIKGDKKRLVDMSQKNAFLFMKDRQKKQEQLDPEAATSRLMQTMKADLKMRHEPRHIECFDNSNIQGTSPTSACVVFRNGKPAKRDYRNFNVRTVEGPDDFESMKEAVYRRYRRLLEDGDALPQLLVIDGGKGQVSHAMEALEELDIARDIKVVGIAKRLEELFFAGDSTPYYLDKRSQTLKVIQQMRNEAHRFSLAHHRKRRSKKSLHSVLDEIKGVGPASKEKLLTHFGSVDGVKKASTQELVNIVGEGLAKVIRTFFDLPIEPTA
jgi:excinuclease ABC subunit C|tara:strand:- start:745 stop:2562 length:1818 start_codon:yes stop_codon:yes gene_type:complete